jgi:hypothetical protein
MITNQHNDGCCFKLTVSYSPADYSDERKYVMYGEDMDELWAHFLEVRHVWDIVNAVVIEDYHQPNGIVNGEIYPETVVIANFIDKLLA